MRSIIVVGPDRGLEAAFAAHDIDVAGVEGVATGEALAEAGVEAADLLVVTDAREAIAIAVARDVNPDLRVVVYSPDSMPEFVSGQVDLALDPDLFDPDVVAEELVAAGG